MKSTTRVVASCVFLSAAGIALVGTNASAQSPSALAQAACGATADMLTPTYPGTNQECFEYIGSSVMINFVVEDEYSTRYGLLPAPLTDPRLSAATTVHDIRGFTSVKDFSTTCDVVVVHEWARVEPCGSPVTFKNQQLAKFKKGSAPTVNLSPTRRSVLTGKAIMELANVAKTNAKAVPNCPPPAAIDSFFDVFTEMTLSQSVGEANRRKNVRPFVYEFAALTLGKPGFQSASFPPSLAPTRASSTPTPKTQPATPQPPARRP